MYQFYVVVVYWVVVGGDYYVVGGLVVEGLEIDFFGIVQFDVDYIMVCIGEFFFQGSLQFWVVQVDVVFQDDRFWFQQGCGVGVNVFGEGYVQFFWNVVVDVVCFEIGECY